MSSLGGSVRYSSEACTATVTLDDDSRVIRLTAAEKLAALRRDVRVPLSQVRGVTVERDAWAAARGLRAPGLAIRGRTKIGTWRSRGCRRLVVARRGVPAIRVTLAGDGDDELLVSAPGADAIAQQIRAAARVQGG
jgi:hypothetical protein